MAISFLRSVLLKGSFLILLIFSFLFLTFTGCDKDSDNSINPEPVNSGLTESFGAEMVVDWIHLELKLARTSPGWSPPVVSRGFGYTGVALYESVVGGMPEYQSLIGQLSGLTSLPKITEGAEYHWPTCANNALAKIITSLFANTSAENLNSVDSLKNLFNDQYKAEVSAEIYNRSVEWGETIAEAIFEWSKSDGGHEAYNSNFPADYIPPVGDGYWVPTPPAYQPALQPYWGSKRTFIPLIASTTVPPPPTEYSEDTSSDFYLEAYKVYETVNNLTSEQEEIALFWSDDPGITYTPPGHSMAILYKVLESGKYNLAVAAEAYAKVGMAVADAFVSCWNAKYIYNLVRPVTVIQEMMDPNWLPILNTPPFPEYTSGHSVQSGAAAQVLSDLFGYSYSFTDDTHLEDIGMAPRNFESFFHFANEAAISRLYGGIHYLPAIEIGVEQGIEIGKKVSALRFRK